MPSSRNPGPVPIVRGRPRSYYLFQEGGHRMAVVNLSKGSRLRIGDTIELVVLDVRDGAVEFGVLHTPA